MGRRKTINADAVFTVKLPKDLRAKFIQAAIASGQTPSEVARMQMRDFVAAVSSNKS